MEDIIEWIKSLGRRIEIIERGMELRNVSIPSDGYIIVRKLSSDPAEPMDGEIWYNTTEHKYKGCEDGVIKTFTSS